MLGRPVLLSSGWQHHVSGAGWTVYLLSLSINSSQRRGQCFSAELSVPEAEEAERFTNLSWMSEPVGA
jgi:hypothetical protein